MKRIVLTALTTITGIVLLVGVKSQTGAPGLATLAAPGTGSGSTATKRTPTPDVTPTPKASGTPTPTGEPTPRKKKLTARKSSGTRAKSTPKATAAPKMKAAPKKAAPRPKPVAKVKVVGQTADTPYGPVQVKVTMLGHRITDVTALQLPSGNQRSSEIAGFAAPALRREALSTQSAHIDSVSGATYTSEGYRTSLQSALDRAGA
ncbi:FMN-binding protein [Actinopolymorpha sp. NPDC004070]|uniref:FMN-binding protein n=1 Tax=Actinopolymorpha sp. NPDC004070 TaxID=3154548 RepID=UPI0033A0121B